MLLGTGNRKRSRVIYDRNDWIDASLLGELPCFEYTAITSLDGLNNVCDSIECLMIGNGCLNPVGSYTSVPDIDFSRFLNVRVFSVGEGSLMNMNTIVISSLIIVGLLIWSSQTHTNQYRPSIII